jgi:alpha-amylase
LAPSNLSATASGNNVTLTWVDNADNETGFEIYRSEVSATEGFAIVGTAGVDATTFTETIADGYYYYKVRATGDVEPSNYSNVDELRVGPEPEFIIYFRNTDNWNPVNIYLFDFNADAAIPGWNWPGEGMTKVENTQQWYSYDVQETVRPVGVVFNNGGALKSLDLQRSTTGWYDFGTKSWSDECPGDCPTEPVPVLTADPMGGTYENSVTVTLEATEGGSITYTTDGTDPLGKTSYTEELTFTTTTTLRAIAVNDAGESNEINELYEIVYPKPELTVDPAGQEFVGSIDVSLVATKEGAITFTTDGSDPKSGDAWTGNPYTITDTTNLRAIALNQNGYSNEINETYYPVESQCDTVYYYNRYGWSQVMIYLFNIDGSAIPGWSWCGVEMTQIDNSDWYYFVKCDEDGEVGMVFNNCSGQKEDDTFASGGWFYNGSWSASCPGNCPGEQPEGLTLHLKKPSNWGSAYVYFWNTSPITVSTIWPGEVMTDDDGDGWYDYTIEGVECANVIFNDNGYPQTNNLYNICSESWYDGGWVSPPAKAVTNVKSSFAHVSEPYPNPFSNEIQLTFTEITESVLVKLTNINGEEFYAQEYNDVVGELNINVDVNSGVYVLQIQVDGKVSHHKMVKY